MTINLYVFVIACCVFVAACLACLALGYHWGRDDGYQAAEDDRKIARAEARRGRHARTQPRTPLAGPPPALPPEMTSPRPVSQQGERIPGFSGLWYRGHVARADAGRWRTWSAATPPRAVPTAASIAPVVLPEPGTYLPGPRRSTSPNTVTFPKVQLDTASTGEIRAIGDEMVAAIEAAGEAS